VSGGAPPGAREARPGRNRLPSEGNRPLQDRLDYLASFVGATTSTPGGLRVSGLGSPATPRRAVRGICEKPRIKCAQCPHRRMCLSNSWRRSHVDRADSGLAGCARPGAPGTRAVHGTRQRRRGQASLPRSAMTGSMWAVLRAGSELEMSAVPSCQDRIDLSLDHR
jgi:hypothetical protein